jgi:hypothetical protein
MRQPEGAMFKEMKKRDWAFVAVCLAAAIGFGTLSVKLGVEHYRATHGATEFSSSQRSK